MEALRRVSGKRMDMFIGLPQQFDKLVFVRMRPKLPVIANQSSDWCGNPPVERNQVTITTKNRGDSHSFGNYSVHFPSNRGIATPVCALARNDSKNV